MLDREFTLQEIDGAIKHLKSGKAAGSDDIRNEYISYENKQLKPILQLLFNANGHSNIRKVIKKIYQIIIPYLLNSVLY